MIEKEATTFDKIAQQTTTKQRSSVDATMAQNDFHLNTE